jgi:hypothetical protein
MAWQRLSGTPAFLQVNYIASREREDISCNSLSRSIWFASWTHVRPIAVRSVLCGCEALPPAAV